MVDEIISSGPVSKYRTADEIRAATDKALANNSKIKEYFDFVYNAIDIAHKCNYQVRVVFKESDYQSNIWKGQKVSINWNGNYHTLIPPEGTINFTGMEHIAEQLQDMGYRVELADPLAHIGHYVNQGRIYHMVINWE